MASAEEDLPEWWKRGKMWFERDDDVDAMRGERPPMPEALKRKVESGEVKLGPGGNSWSDPDFRKWVLDCSAWSRKTKTRRNGMAVNMSKEVVAHRLNEAEKLISIHTIKDLPKEVQKATGLEKNPLHMMERLVHSGILSPKDCVNALRTLAEYTHMKRPQTIDQTTTVRRAEDFLLSIDDNYPEHADKIRESVQKALDHVDEAEVIDDGGENERGRGREDSEDS